MDAPGRQSSVTQGYLAVDGPGVSEDAAGADSSCHAETSCLPREDSGGSRATRADLQSSGKHIGAAQEGLVYEDESGVVDKETQLWEMKKKNRLVLKVTGNNL